MHSAANTRKPVKCLKSNSDLFLFPITRILEGCNKDMVQKSGDSLRDQSFLKISAFHPLQHVAGDWRMTLYPQVSHPGFRQEEGWKGRGIHRFLYILH